MRSLLEVNDLSVRFRVRSRLAAFLKHQSECFREAVSGVSFEIREGETFGMVGESGSGKSTLARAISGLVPIQSGSITFQSWEIQGRSDRALNAARRRMALMFQDPVGSLSPRLRVRSLIAEPLRLRGLKGSARKDEIMRLLARVGLNADFADRFPHELSGGQARRVGLARALAGKPKLLIADEPTAGLDVSVQGEVLNLMQALQQSDGISILLITHNLSVVRCVSDQLGVLYRGRLVEQGPCQEIFRHPQHSYTEALLSAHTPLPPIPASRQGEREDP